MTYLIFQNEDFTEENPFPANARCRNFQPCRLESICEIEIIFLYPSFSHTGISFIVMT
jgi:hypothetical protein